MATFAQIKTRVERRVIDLPAAVLAEVGDLVNEALTELQTTHSFKVMEAETDTLITDTTTHNLALVPDAFKEFRGKPYLIPSVGRTIPLVYATSRRAVLRSFNDTDTGPPAALLDAEPDDDGVRFLEIWPLSDVNSDYTGADAGEYRIRAPYYRFLPELSADGASNWFTVNAAQWLITRATAEAFALDWNEERYAVWLQKANVELRKVVLRDKIERVSLNETLTTHWQGANDSELAESEFNPPFNVNDWF